MRVLLALTFLLWHIADARFASEQAAVLPDPDDIFREPPFISGKTHVYELTINTTSGIPGLTSQVAKSLIRADVRITPATDSEYILKLEYVRLSEPRSGVDSPSAPHPLRRSPELERDLTKPIRFTYRDGAVKAYTLGLSEGLPSRSIKRAILRHLQLKLQPYTKKPQIPEDQPERYPVTYNVTEVDETGRYEAIYSVNMSPNPDYPSEGKVFNVSKVISYERYGYPSYFKRQNFAKEGYRARYEKNEDPVKSSKIIHHNLRILQGETVVESIRAEENDAVTVYDQDVVVSTVSQYVLKEVSDQRTEEPQEQQIHFTELNIAPTEDELRRDQPRSYDEVTKEYQFIYGILDDIRSSELVLVAQRILEKVSDSIVAAEIESRRGQQITEDIANLQDVLSLLKKVHLDAVFRQIVDARVLRRSPEKEKVKRQIFLDVLPLTGTEDSVRFIKYLIEKKKLTVYEAKEVLEAIPANLIEATENIVQDLLDLVELPHVRRYHVLYSAAYLTVANVIREAFTIPELSYDYSEEEYPRSSDEDRQDYESRYPGTYGKGEEETRSEYSDLPRRQQHSRRYRREDYDDEREHYFSESGRQQNPQRDEVLRRNEDTLRKLLERVSYKLRSARRLQEKAVYIQALARVGHKKALEILKPYLYGVSDDTAEYTPDDVDFVKIVTLCSLHNIVQHYPEETQEVVIPVYFNRTESPRVRIAAFSVLLRSEPSLALLQHVAQDSYEEPSNEVGSYIYSALESFGDAWDPYLKTTAERIKLVIPQVKKYDIGKQYSKTIIKTFFDELRNYGIEKIFEVVQNGESFIPSSLYSSLKYKIQALQDVLYQARFNVQGVTAEDLLRAIDIEVLGLTSSRDIPSGTEDEIFGSLRLLPRLPQELRITIYKKIFYAESFQYFDTESFGNYIIPLVEYLRDHFVVERGYVNGHFVKTFIPSSYQSLTYSSIGFPVNFRVKHPLILSLKVQSRRPPRRTSESSYVYYIRPSVYSASYYKHSVSNTAVGRSYGVYQEQKYALTFPVELYLSVDSEAKTLELSYKLPEVSKPIYKFHSEAGTYETELQLGYVLGAQESRRPIRTLPAVFKNEQLLSVPGLPSLYISYRTEDIREEYPKEVRNLYDAAELIYNALRNPGLKRKAVNVAIITDPSSPVDQVTFKIKYQKFLDAYRRTHYGDRSQSNSPETEDEQSSRSKDEDYARGHVRETQASVLSSIFPRGERSRYQYEQITPEQAFRLREAFDKDLSKTSYEVSIRVETSPTPNVAELRVQYNRTFDRTIHSFRAEGEARIPEERELYKVYLENVLRYTESPNEYKYDPRAYVGQYATFYQTISFGEYRRRYDQGDVIVQGAFVRVPSEFQFSRDELSVNPGGEEAFVPASQAECLKDVQEGKSQSPACIAAVREDARLNKAYVRITTHQDLPRAVQNIAYEAERAINQYYYDYADIQREEVNSPEGTVETVINYVDKLTDKPVLDVVVKKPKETITYRKVDADYVEPLSSVYSLFDSYVLSATNNTYPPSCGLMEKYVRTYDQQVYALPRDSCTYVLSAHCTERKKFAVLARQTSDSDDTKEITVYLANKKVVLVSRKEPREIYTIIYNDRPVEVRAPTVLNEENLLYVYPINVNDERVRQILVLRADKAGIKVEYDGRNAKLQVSYLYKGELCGLCSEFDGESTREYRGPDKCLYSDSEDFVRSSVTDADTCGVRTTPKNPVLCSSAERRVQYRRTRPGYESQRKIRYSVLNEEDLERYYNTDAEDYEEKSRYSRDPQVYSEEKFDRPYDAKVVPSEESRYSTQSSPYYYRDRYESYENSRYPYKNEYSSYKNSYYSTYGERYPYDDQEDSAQRARYTYGDGRDGLYRETYRYDISRNSLNFRYPYDEQNYSYKISRRPYNERESREKSNYPYENEYYSESYPTDDQDYSYRRYSGSSDEKRDYLRKYSYPYKNKYEKYGNDLYPYDDSRNRTGEPYYRDNSAQKYRYYPDSSRTSYDQEDSSEEYPYDEKYVRGNRLSYGGADYLSRKYQDTKEDEYGINADYPYSDDDDYYRKYYERQDYRYGSSSATNDEKDEAPEKSSYSYYQTYKKSPYPYDDDQKSYRNLPYEEKNYLYRRNLGPYGEREEKYGYPYGDKYGSHGKFYRPDEDQDYSYRRIRRSYNEKDPSEKSGYSYDDDNQSYKKSRYPYENQEYSYYKSQDGDIEDVTKQQRYSSDAYETYRNRPHDEEDYRKGNGSYEEREDRRDKYRNPYSDKYESYRKFYYPYDDQEYSYRKYRRSYDENEDSRGEADSYSYDADTKSYKTFKRGNEDYSRRYETKDTPERLSYPFYDKYEAYRRYRYPYEDQNYAYITSRRSYREKDVLPKKSEYSYDEKYTPYKTSRYPSDDQDYSDSRYGIRYEEIEDTPKESRNLQGKYEHYSIPQYGQQYYSYKRNRRNSYEKGEDKTDKYLYKYGDKDEYHGESYYPYEKPRNSYQRSRSSYDGNDRYESYRNSRYDDQSYSSNRYGRYYDDVIEVPEESRYLQGKYESYRSRPYNEQDYSHKTYRSPYEERQDRPEQYNNTDESYRKSYYPYDDQVYAYQKSQESYDNKDSEMPSYFYDQQYDPYRTPRYSYDGEDYTNGKYRSSQDEREDRPEKSIYTRDKNEPYGKPPKDDDQEKRIYDDDKDYSYQSSRPNYDEERDSSKESDESYRKSRYPYKDQDYLYRNSRRSYEERDTPKKYTSSYDEKYDSYRGTSYPSDKKNYDRFRQSFGGKQDPVEKTKYPYSEQYKSRKLPYSSNDESNTSENRYPYGDENDSTQKLHYSYYERENLNRKYNSYFDEEGDYSPEKSRYSYDRKPRFYRKYGYSYYDKADYKDSSEQETDYPYDVQEDLYRKSRRQRDEKDSGEKYIRPYYYQADSKDRSLRSYDDDENDSSERYRYLFKDTDQYRKTSSYIYGDDTEKPRYSYRYKGDLPRRTTYDVQSIPFRRSGSSYYDKNSYQESDYPYDDRRGLYDKTARNYYGVENSNENSPEKGQYYRRSRYPYDDQSDLSRRPSYEERSVEKSYDPYTVKDEGYKRSYYPSSDKNEYFRRSVYPAREEESYKQQKSLQTDENTDDSTSYRKDPTERRQRKERRVRFQLSNANSRPFYRYRYDEKKAVTPLDSVKDMLVSALFPGRRYKLRE